MLPTMAALCVFGYIGIAERSWPTLVGAAAMVLLLVLIFVVYVAFELRNWKSMNRRLSRHRSRWWWKWWQRPSYPSPTTDQGVEKQFWYGFGWVMLICVVCVACGCGPLLLALLFAAYL